MSWQSCRFHPRVCNWFWSGSLIQFWPKRLESTSPKGEDKSQVARAEIQKAETLVMISDQPRSTTCLLFCETKLVIVVWADVRCALSYSLPRVSSVRECQSKRPLPHKFTYGWAPLPCYSILVLVSFCENWGSDSYILVLCPHLFFYLLFFLKRQFHVLIFLGLCIAHSQNSVIYCL